MLPGHLRHVSIFLNFHSGKMSDIPNTFYLKATSAGNAAKDRYKATPKNWQRVFSVNYTELLPVM